MKTNTHVKLYTVLAPALAVLAAIPAFAGQGFNPARAAAQRQAQAQPQQEQPERTEPREPREERAAPSHRPLPAQRTAPPPDAGVRSAPPPPRAPAQSWSTREAPTAVPAVPAGDRAARLRQYQQEQEQARNNRPPPPQNGGNYAPRNDYYWRGGQSRGFYGYGYPYGRYVHTLPPGYRSYHWNGSPYYWYGGSWYRPYGSRFVVIGAPVGLFVSTLPAYYSTVWIGGSRYYYADDTYYTYEPQRRGYVVARSPYGADEDEQQDDGQVVDDDLYVYPTRGQNEEQQSEDRYQCHRWAVEQTEYDPTEGRFDAEERAEYDRAITACLEGRGYSVK